MDSKTVKMKCAIIYEGITHIHIFKIPTPIKREQLADLSAFAKQNALEYYRANFPDKNIEITDLILKKGSFDLDKKHRKSQAKVLPFKPK